jgi:hypothetical protein
MPSTQLVFRVTPSMKAVSIMAPGMTKNAILSKTILSVKYFHAVTFLADCLNNQCHYAECR